jgi:hypothetical protein
MAGSANPGYNSDMQALSIPDNDIPGEQPDPMIDWAGPIPGQPPSLVDSLTGDSVQSGQPFIRVVSNQGQSDVLDGTA